jgi:TldD protein
MTMLTLALGTMLAAAPSDVANSTLMRALRDEVGRAKDNLALHGQERPYYLRVSVEDDEQVSLLASFGALDRDDRIHSRILRAQVRVGDTSLDNSNFVSRRVQRFGGGLQLPIEDDYDSIRRAVWLAIDGAYKQALQNLAQKRAALKTHTRPESHAGDCAEQTPAKTYGPRLAAPLNGQGLADRVRKLSAAFRDYREIQKSRVELSAATDESYFVDSDGAESYGAQSLARFHVVAHTQAEDGMRLGRTFESWAATPAELPDDAALGKAVRGLASELIALRQAPTIDDYTGPVLFEGKAAPQLALEILGSRLGGTPPPLAEDPRYAERFSDTDLARRVGQRVLGGQATVEDDPGRERGAGEMLIGAYRVDDEGVPAQKVTLIKAGMLTGFLMSRTPREGFPKSNGHGRVLGGGEPKGLPGVLVVRAETRGDDVKTLRAKLLKAAKENGLDYAYVVRAISDGSEAGPQDFSIFSFMAQSRTSTAPPSLMYRVHLDGKEELVRGARMNVLPLRALREVSGIGRDETAFNVMSSGSSMLGSAMFGFSGGGFLQGIPTSCVSSALLFPTVELTGQKAGEDRPPYLEHPYFVGR